MVLDFCTCNNSLPFFFFFLAVLRLHRCTGFSLVVLSGCGSPVAVHGFLWVSHCSGVCCGAEAPGPVSAAVVASRL